MTRSVLFPLRGVDTATVPWGVIAGSGTGWAITVPALAGLVIGDIAILATLRYRRHSAQEVRAR